MGFAALALIVFLVGARNEYGDSDSEGVVIHVYLVYAIGLLMALIPWAMSKGARLVSDTYATVLIAISIVWTISAPVFFFLPNWIDGLYERYLGLIAFAAVITLARCSWPLHGNCAEGLARSRRSPARPDGDVSCARR